MVAEHDRRGSEEAELANADLTFEEVAEQLEAVEEAASALGCTIWRPFMVLSFMALSVIPALKLTDRGLVDVEAWELVTVSV